MTGSSPYIGRFAPSPSGPLHFGSLIAALASYLDARASNGKWLLRMEDIDEPRCIAGADKSILKALDAHGLLWDGEVIYQSQQHDRYQSAVDRLISQDQAYYCTCTRKMIKETGGVYQKTCRHSHHSSEGAAVRLKLDSPVRSFHDRILGDITVTDQHALEDTVLKRRDSLFSYNLVVVLDDIFQGVTDIVRGSDLLTTTATHLSLYALLNAAPPRYAHIPVASVAEGRKLSKQNHATALDNGQAKQNLLRALSFLGMAPPEGLLTESMDGMLQWAIGCWNCDKLPRQREIIVAATESTYHTFF